MPHLSRTIVICCLCLLLAGCSNAAPRDKFFSFLYPAFYLKVIDQDGRPVSGVEADVTHGGNAFITGSNAGWARYVSDADGLIAIKVDSRQITFDRMAKAGYSIDLSKILFHFFQTRSYGVPAQSDLWPADFSEHTKEHPFVIRSWRVDEAELRAQCKNGVVRKSLEPDGRPYGIDLFQRGKNLVLENAPARAMQIQFFRENSNLPASSGRIDRNHQFRKKWRYSLSLSNGGLQEVDSSEFL